VLGFIGLGRMGGPMSTRLVQAGHALIGFDVAGTRERLPDGASPAASVAEVAEHAETVFLSLPTGDDSLAVCQEVLAARRRATKTVVDLSTIGIASARACAGLLEPNGVQYVDAPVSGGVAGAVAGSLALMVGAPQPVFEALEPVWSAIAQNRFRMGDTPGQGQAMKLVNNYIFAAALAATAEGVVLGTRLGLDPAQVVEVLNVSSGRTLASQLLFPKSVIPGTYDFGFSGTLMAKDVRLYLESASQAGVAHALAERVVELWREVSDAYPGEDCTTVHKYAEATSAQGSPLVT
jgi:3-hydroxyisobutyrate dehydrogenase-like beta-hydroxyacid dehydrogenase